MFFHSFFNDNYAGNQIDIKKVWCEKNSKAAQTISLSILVVFVLSVAQMPVH